MTGLTKQQTNSASLDGGSPPAQLPAYSETDGQSDAGFEKVEAPRSLAQQTYMTAEEEKAYLSSRDRPEAAGGLQPNTYNQSSVEWNQQHHPSAPNLAGIYGKPREGETPAQILSRGLQVPSCSRKVSSGFPYPDILHAYGVSPKEWSTFTSEITQAAQLTSKDWSITVGAGVATLAASGIFIGWFGLIPAFFVGHHLRCAAENKNLRAAKDTGDLEAKLLRWNEITFAPRGFLVRLDLPGDETSDLERMDVFTPKKWGRKCGGGRHSNAASWNKEGRCAQRAEKRAQFLKKKTAKKGRIVIVPLNSVNRSRTEATMDSNQMPMSEKQIYTEAVREV
jgi:Domain of unknown function (DUF4646)